MTKGHGEAAVGVAHFAPDGRLLYANTRFVGWTAAIAPRARLTLQALFRSAAALDSVAAVLGGTEDRVSFAERLESGVPALVHLSRVRIRGGDRVVCTLDPATEGQTHAAVIEQVSRTLNGLSGREFAEQLVVTLAAVCGAETAFLSQVTADHKLEKIAEARLGAIAERPAEPDGSARVLSEMAGDDVLFCSRSAAHDLAGELAPGVIDVAAIAVRSASSSTPIGVLCVGATAPMDAPLVGTLLPIYGRRAAVEMQRGEEEARRRKRDQLVQIAEQQSQTGVWMLDVASGVVNGSQQAAAMLGRTLPCSISAITEAIAAPDQARVAELFSRIASAPGIDLVCRIAVGGDTRALHIIGWPERDRGITVEYAGTIRDITTSESVGQSIALLSTAAEQSRHHLVITDAEGGIEYMNPAARAGLAAAGSVGSRLSSLIGIDRYQRATLVARGGGVYRDVLQIGDPLTHTWLEITLSAVRDRNGVATNFVLLACDVTAQRQADAAKDTLDKAVRKAAREWRQTVDTIGAAILMVDRARTVRRMNRSARLLLQASDYSAVGSSIDALPDEEPWSTSRLLIASGRQSAQCLDPRSGRSFEVTTSSSSIDRSDDESAVIVIRDITDQLRLEESLRRGHTMSVLGGLVGGVAHEIRNPIFGISATLDALEAELGDAAQFRDYTHMLRREVTKLRLLTRDLLEYGRPAELELDRVRLGEVIAAAAQLCSPASGVEIDNRVRPGFGAIRGDRLKLQQAFRNVIENALQHAPASSRVTLTAFIQHRSAGRVVVCRVRDEGPGFCSEDLPHIFDPFFTRRAGGTGLGLSIVQRTVEEHGGIVFGANYSEGGAVVTIELPLDARGEREAFRRK